MPDHDDESARTRPSLAFRERTDYVLIVAAFALAALFLAWWLRWALALTFAAVLVGVFFHGGATLVQWAVRRTVNRRFGHGASLAIFCALLLLAATGFGFLAAPALSQQVDQLQDKLPRSVEAVRDYAQQTKWGQWLLDEGPLGDAGQLVSDPAAVMRRGMVWVGSAVTVFGSLVFLLFTGLYAAAEPGLYRRGILWLLPPRDRERADAALKSVGRSLTYWLAGQLCSMTIIGVLTGVGLWALGIPLPFVLAVLTAVLTFIPNFGPVASVVPPALLAFGTEGRYWQDGSLALAVMALYFSIQFLESYLVTPLIQKRAVEMPPVLLIFAQLVMGTLAGIIGVAVAAPMIAAITAASKELVIVGDTDKEDPKDRAHDDSD